MNTHTQTTVLENGVTIATVEMPHMESACFGMWANVGSRHETPRINGIAHFVEHLLFKGTPTRDSMQISREIEGLGGSVDACTTEDHTCYYTRGPAETLPQLADVMLDMLCRPTFDPTELEREREVILEEIAMYRDNPSQHVEDLLGAAAWPEHPLGQPITGTEQSVAGLRRGDIFAFHQKFYCGENIVIVSAGKVTHEEVLALTVPILETLPKKNEFILDRVPGGLRSNGPRRFLETREIEQSHLSIGFHSCGRDDPERYAAKMLNVMLGENMSSRLFQVLREEHGLCYSVFSDILALEDTGMLTVSTGLDLANVPKALDLIERCVREFAEQEVAPDRLQQAKNYVIGQNRLALESTTQQMMWAGESLQAWGRIVEPEETFSRLKAVSTADVVAIADKLFRPEGTAIAYIGAEVPDLEIEAFLSK